MRKKKTLPKPSARRQRRSGGGAGGLVLMLLLLLLLLALAFGALQMKSTSVVRTYEVHISRADQTMTVYGDGRILRTIAVSTGRLGAETPTGTYHVQAKDRHHTSNLFCVANDWSSSYRKDPADACRPGFQEFPMSFGIQYDGAYWMHVGPMNNRPTHSHGLSAGCTRMVYDDAQWLFDRIPVGTKIVII